ncbi:hypothetical protein [Microscilla marina]|uniref:Uncharacterized protein n=1 Tax=Microscilla marina ATCC 23134 TaxID=313606 RepID=A1ZQ14_MICM2|nr:hypothetical protein [Microscilla marina]EAY27423.1 hypothetical protein M23134_06824 [Microscilla marina ATCC 23134]
MSSLQLIFNNTKFEKSSTRYLHRFSSTPSNLFELLDDLKEISLEEVKAFKLDIAQLTQEDAQLLLHLLAFTSLLRLPFTPYNANEKNELLSTLNQLSLQASPYLDILPKIAAGEMSSTEAEHYMLKMLHKGQSRKSKRRTAKRLENL